MVYTVTFNPSLDYVVNLDEFNPGQVNRTSGEKLMPGGKGINVSMVLNSLEIENTALGFVAGFTGNEIEKNIRETGCKTDFIKVENGFSRINVKIKTNQESEINGQGPEISKADLEKLFEKIQRIQKDDVLVLAGSIPKSLSSSVYMDIMESICETGAKIVVDATGSLLKNVLKCKPFLIKPNNFEMEEIFGVKINNEAELIEYAKKLKTMGAVNVLISRAGDGAILLDEAGEVISMEAPAGKVVNSVGAGDSMVAGFIAGYLKNKDYKYALRLGIASGSASAFSENLATKEEIFKVLDTVK